METRPSVLAAKWREMYFRDGAWKRTMAHEVDPQEVYGRLSALEPDALPEQVTKAIGSDSWCKLLECDECGVPSDPVVSLGPDYVYEQSPINVCVACLRSALTLAGG